MTTFLSPEKLYSVRKYYSGRPDGEAGNRTSYSPVGAGTEAELGNMKEDIVHNYVIFNDNCDIMGTFNT